MWRKPHGLRRLFVTALLMGMVAWVAVGQNAKRINDNALRDAAKSKEDWISYNRDWSETRFSPLDQINAANVSKLGLAWSFDIPNVGAGNRQEATHLVANGVLYSITPWSVVYAVDARTGKELWQADPQANRSASACCGVVNRGIALYEGKVIAPVIDGRIRALDMQTGKLVWETRVTPTNYPYTITMAPRVIKGGRVIIGASGGEYAVRGLFAAYDADNGKELWKFYTVPGDPSKPFEQPIHAEWAKTWDASKKWWVAGGGGPVWGSIAYDDDEDLVYVGTGQPGPWSSAARGPGDNLCTNCIIAVKGATGKYAWHYQTTPGDDWDYDSIADITLADLRINGRNRKVLMHAPKNGFFFVIDRVSGEFISAEPWVTVSWATGIDPKTGRANVNPAARSGLTPVNVTPGPGGGHVWPPQSYSPVTGLVYIPSTIGGGYSFSGDPDYVIVTSEIKEGERGRMQMGAAPRGGGGGGGGGGRGGAAGAAPGLAPGLDPNAVPPVPGAAGAPAAGAAGRGGGAGGGGGGGARGAAPQGPQPPASRLLVLTLDGKPITTPTPAPAAAGPGGGAATGQAAGGGRGGGGGTGAAAGAGGGAAAGQAAGGAGGGRGGGAGAGGGGGRGGGGGAPALPTIGPQGRGSILVAWNPVTQKEAWRGPSGSSSGFNAGGTLATAGNLVFTNVANRLLAFKADTGEQVLDLPTGVANPGPPMTFMIDGKQYIAIAGSIGGGGGGGGGGRGGGAAAPATPAGGAAAPAAGQGRGQ
jgi:PQQ-dependent dehydrogenase (methanol/ethanol family)